MPEEHQYRDSVIAAERAAEAGDFARAEALLRAGLHAQEQEFGSQHPDLASTLNNLAVVCETNGRLEDAEQFYRRAVAVATAALNPTDERVVTSRANLLDFCTAHGVSVDEWPEVVGQTAAASAVRTTAPWARPDATPAAHSTGAAPATSGAVRATSPTRPAPPVVHPRPPAPVGTSSRATRGAPVGLIGALAILAVAATATVGWLWLAAPVQPQAVTQAEGDASAPAPTPAPAPAPEPPLAAPTPAPVEPAPPVVAPSPGSPDPAVAPPPATASSGLRLVTADVCRTLDRSAADWRCDPAGAAGPPGQVSYYTRVAADRPMRLEHRWYRDGTLLRTAQLEIGANSREGFRTFSRQTLTPGQWRMELRAPDGAILHQIVVDVSE